MEDINVMIKNLTDCSVSIVLPELKYQRTFERKDAVKPMPFSVFKEAIWDEGFMNLVKEGCIEILTPEAKEEADINFVHNIEEVVEAELNGTSDNTIVVLDDKQKKRYLTVAPINDLKVMLSKLSNSQVKELADYAIKNSMIDYERDDLIKKRIGVDIPKAIEFKRTMEA